MGEEKLTGLALMYIHKDINTCSESNIKNIIDRFSKGKTRKLDFILQMCSRYLLNLFYSILL